MSTTSEITGTEFRKVFSDYYQISNNMSDLIDDAIDESIKSTEYLKQAIEGGSEEKGGLYLLSMILLRNRQGEVTAGVSGLQEDDVPFWSGADYTNRKKPCSGYTPTEKYTQPKVPSESCRSKTIP